MYNLIYQANANLNEAKMELLGTATDNHSELCTIGASTPPLGTHSPLWWSIIILTAPSIFRKKKSCSDHSCWWYERCGRLKKWRLWKWNKCLQCYLKKKKKIPVRSFVTGFNGNDGSHRDSPRGMKIQGHLAEDVVCTVVRQLDKSVAVLTPLSTVSTISSASLEPWPEGTGQSACNNKCHSLWLDFDPCHSLALYNTASGCTVK